MSSSRIELIVPGQSKAALDSFTEQAAKRAVYFDYEGIHHGKPPVFVGWQIEGVYSGSIIDPAFGSCAHKYKATAIGAGDHGEVMRSLIELAFVEDRHLVSWSWHDLKLIWPLIPRRSQELFTNQFVNAIRVARRWHTRYFGPGLKNKHAKLSYFARATGMKIPDKYGEKLVANHLLKVGKALAAKGSYGALSTDEKASWRNATKHNQWDLRATSFVCTEILRGARPAPGFAPPKELMSHGAHVEA